MFARHHRIIGIFFVTVDFLLALSSFHLAFDIRSHLHAARNFYPLSSYPWYGLLCILLWLIAGFATGIYREVHEENLRRAFSDPLKTAVVATLLLFAATFALQLAYISRLLLGIYAILDFSFMVTFRLAAWRF